MFDKISTYWFLFGHKVFEKKSSYEFLKEISLKKFLDLGFFLFKLKTLSLNIRMKLYL